MRAVGRGLLVLAVSAVLAGVLWILAERVGSPTPTEMRPGLDQPAIVGLQHTVQFLVVGTVLWAAVWTGIRLVESASRRRPRR